MTMLPLLSRALVTLLILAETQWSTELRTGQVQQIKSRAPSSLNSILASAGLETRGRRAASRFNLEVAGGGTKRVVVINGNVTSTKDVEVLLSFKKGITSDPLGVLSSWRANSSDPCSWLGVECSSPNSIHVTGLNLRGLSLEGRVSDSLGQLSFLQHLDLSINVLHGSIPTSLTNCSNLMYLNMSFNQLTGEIPALVGNLGNLVTLELAYNNISGELPSTIVNCSSLQNLFLGKTALQGAIPSQIGLLSNLRYLDLFSCFFSGSIPTSLGNCSSLIGLNFGLNSRLGGELPIELGKLTHLDYFLVEQCDFYGSFPMWVLNATAIHQLDLAYCHIGGLIPEELGTLNLIFLSLHGNNFSGVIPKSMGNITSLQTLYLYDNQLTGSIPDELGLLRNLIALVVRDNALIGLIPPSLSNCSLLDTIVFGHNKYDPQPFPHWIVSLRDLKNVYLDRSNLQGSIPNEMGQLSQLLVLVAFQNNLTGGIPSSVRNCTSLWGIELTTNQLSREIPSELGLVASLKNFNVADNRFPPGPFPAFLFNLTNLSSLQIDQNQFIGMLGGDFGRFEQLDFFGASNNDFQGPIPESLANCTQLAVLDFGGNSMSGGLPSSLTNLTNLNFLLLGSNHFDGAIPVDFMRNFRRLQEFDVSDNNLGGPIPPFNTGQLLYLQRLNMSGNSIIGPVTDSLANCSQLLYLDLSNNQLTGTLPGDAFASMIYLTVLDLSRNSLSGSWPPQISQLEYIEVINISSNMMSGSIPLTLGGLRSLRSLDVSFNQFTGQIPADLGLLVNLTVFNASYNNFSGPIPDSGASKANLTAGSFLGNPGLCGEILGPQRHCPSSQSTQSHCRGFRCKEVWIPVASVLGPVTVTFVLITGVSFLILNRQIKKEKVHRKVVMLTFYPHMSFMESDILAAIAPGQDNVIGAGGQSVVYKGISPVNGTVAIKVSRNVQDAALQDAVVKTTWGTDITREASALGLIRHRNVVKVFCVVYNLEMSCIIMEYMPNGSLHAYLQRDGPSQLNWAQRFKIVLGVTHAMVYLHHDFPDPIIHRDLKPSNILLDEDFEPKVCDFGISRSVTNDKGEATASTFCGTVGYIPPEYGTGGRLSTKGDVYSYGVVLLEILTKEGAAAGRTNTNALSQEDLVSRVKKTVDESTIQAFELLDPALKTEGSQNAVTREQMMLTMRVGVLCTEPMPQNRPSMNDVLQMLLEVEKLGQERVTRKALDDLLEDA